MGTDVGNDGVSTLVLECFIEFGEEKYIQKHLFISSMHIITPTIDRSLSKYHTVLQQSFTFEIINVEPGISYIELK